MSELLNTLTGVLQQFGKVEIAGLLIAVALLLIWLLTRILLRRSEQIEQAPASASRQHKPEPDYATEHPAMQGTDLSKQAGRISQAAAAVESKTVTAPVAEPVTTVAQPCAEMPSTSRIPEDSVLRRHYLAQLQAQKQALANPYPTDSVLRRHYDQLHKLAIDVAPAAARLPEASAPRAAKTSTIEQAIAKDRSISVAPVAPAASAASCKLPQDSVLKRHFIAQLQTEIEANLSLTRPSDSVLRRHYENLVRRELENRLAGFNA